MAPKGLTLSGADATDHGYVSPELEPGRRLNAMTLASSTKRRTSPEEEPGRTTGPRPTTPGGKEARALTLLRGR